MTAKRINLWIVLVILALVVSTAFTSCTIFDKKDPAPQLTAPVAGTKLIFNDFESMDDLFSAKQTNSGSESVAIMDITAEQKNTGSFAFKYSYTKGPNPEILQRFDTSELTGYFALPDATDDATEPLLDPSKLGSTSISVYNASENDITVTLRIVLDGNIALMDSESKIVSPGVWTDVEFELDVLTMANNKDSIVGISFVIGANGSSGDFYFDNWTVTVGAEATPAQQAAPVVKLIDSLPAPEDVADLPSVIKVLSVKGAFDALSSEAQGAVSNKAKLDACLPKVQDYGLLFNASTELFAMVTSSGAGYDWVGNLRNVENEMFGSVAEVNVIRLGSGQIIEMYHQAFANASDYDQIKFFVYNPMTSDKTLIYATGQGWSGKTKTFTLKAEQWTEITLTSKEIGDFGGYFLIQSAQSNGWLFSSIVGVSTASRAQAVSELIAALPSVEAADADDAAAVQEALNAYNALSNVAKELVTNFDKLSALAAKLIYGEDAAPVMDAITGLDSSLGGTVDSFDDIAKINEVKNMYDGMVAEAKSFVSNIDALNAYIEKAYEYQNSLGAVKELIASIDGQVDTYPEIYRVLSAKSIYEALDPAEQAKLFGSAQVNYMKAVSAVKGYTILSDARVDSLLTDPAPGDYTNVSEVRNTLDPVYGNVYALKVYDMVHNATSFKPMGSLKTSDVAAVIVYIKNDTGAWQNAVAAWTLDWSNVISKQCPGAAQGGEVWTEFIIPVKDFYAVADVFFALNSATDGAATNGTWMITSFIGISQEIYDGMAAADTKVLINDLPEAKDITLSHYNVIKAARSSYDGLGDAAKSYVSNYDKLVACEEALNKCISDAAKMINNKIEALPEANELNEENILTCRADILSAKSAYDSAIADVRAGVTGLNKLEALLEKLNEFTPLVINTLISEMVSAEDIDTDAERFYVLYVNNTISALDETAKAEITSENMQKLEACMAVLEGYGIISDSAFSSNLSGGRDTGNSATVTSIANDIYGTVYSLLFANDKGNSDFHPINPSFVGYNKVIFYVYNPYSEDVKLALYDTNWGAQSLAATAKARQWTKVEIDVNGTSYGEKGFFIVVCTGDMLNFNPTSTAEGSWLITSMVGCLSSEKDPTPEAPAGETVLKDATAASQLYLWNSGTNSEGGAAVTVDTDAEHGNVFNIVFNEGVNTSLVGMDTGNMGLTGYDKLRFVIYNSGTEAVNVRIQETSGWNIIGTQSASAGEWTTIEFDLTGTTDKVLLYIDGVPGVEYKMGQLIGVIE